MSFGRVLVAMISTALLAATTPSHYVQVEDRATRGAARILASHDETTRLRVSYVAPSGHSGVVTVDGIDAHSIFSKGDVGEPIAIYPSTFSGPILRVSPSVEARDLETSEYYFTMRDGKLQQLRLLPYTENVRPEDRKAPHNFVCTPVRLLFSFERERTAGGAGAWIKSVESRYAFNGVIVAVSETYDTYESAVRRTPPPAPKLSCPRQYGHGSDAYVGPPI